MTAASGRERTGAMAVPLTLAAALAVLVAAGHGPLAPPPWDDVGAWVEERGPAVAAVALVRLVALGAAGWLLAASTVRVVAAAVGAVRMAAIAEAAMPPAVRRMCAGLAGAGVAGAALVGVADPPETGEAAAPTVRMEVVATTDPEVPDVPPPVAAAPVPNDPSVSMSVADASPPPPLPPPPELAQPASPPTADSWVVEPGDSFWSIAEEVVADRLGRSPSDAEVAGYWSRLVDANADQLVSGDADLIYPGQQLLLPG